MKRLILILALLLAGCVPYPSMKVAQPCTAPAVASAHTFVTVTGRVHKLLPDDLKGSRHQHFLVKVPRTLKVAHNIDLAPYVPLKTGDTVTIRGVLVGDQQEVIHWTHHDPRGGAGGWIELNGKRYQ